MLRVWLADKLVRLAYRLDPNRPIIKRSVSGGWVINIAGVSIARIEPGMIKTERGNLKL